MNNPGVNTLVSLVDGGQGGPGFLSVHKDQAVHFEGYALLYDRVCNPDLPDHRFWIDAKTTVYRPRGGVPLAYLAHYHIDPCGRVVTMESRAAGVWVRLWLDFAHESAREILTGVMGQKMYFSPGLDWRHGKRRPDDYLDIITLFDVSFCYFPGYGKAAQ